MLTIQAYEGLKSILGMLVLFLYILLFHTYFKTSYLHQYMLDESINYFLNNLSLLIILSGARFSSFNRKATRKVCRLYRHYLI